MNEIPIGLTLENIEVPKKKKGVNYKHITIFLSIVLLIIIGYFMYNYITQAVYNEGVVDTNRAISNNIITQLNNQGYFVFYYPINETSSQPIKLGIVE